MAALELSVHQLVDFVLRTGDIDNRVFNTSSMNEGTLIHSLYQSKQGSNYLSEYFLEVSLVIDDIKIHIEGRADGIIKKSSKKYIIDEIKSTVIPLEEFFTQNEQWHLGQAQLYAYMFAKEKGLKDIDIRLTYISQKKHSEKLIKNYSYSFIEIENIVRDYIERYLDFYHLLLDNLNKRNEYISSLPFPFVSYRKGQKELSKYSYAIANKGGRLFVEAPTGIGKTVSTLYPFIKVLPNDDNSKIFYLTAKGSGKENAYKAVKLINDNNDKIYSIVITAKEKVCFCKDKSCNPDECPYTKGYYTKIAHILKYSLLKYHEFDLDKITEIAYEFNVCPFELELDLSLYMDVIICDYNYIFDPVSYMHRYFDDDASHYLALIDEAHNLVDRSRDMYSASIDESLFKEARLSMRKSSFKAIKTQISKLKKIFDGYNRDFPLGNNQIVDLDETLIKVLYRFLEVMVDANKNHHEEVTKEVLEFYLSVNRFMKIYEIANDSFIYNLKREKNFLSIDMICLDASKYLKDIISRLKGSIYFSATLSPIDYYINTLGGNPDTDPVLKLESPFPKENFLMLVAPKISIKYKNRSQTYSQVASYINSFIKGKVGNYLVFVPSYEYLDELIEVLEFPSGIAYFFQKKEMEDKEKEEFISRFKESPSETTVGFAILGGSFAEGIDLVSDRLIGAVIIGIGMPKINFTSDRIMDYYSSHELNGRNYAYIYPGMNKVMQAVGRVIRDEEDKGAVLLIDERYTTNQYQDLFKKEWSQYKVVLTSEEVEEEISSFYNK